MERHIGKTFGQFEVIGITEKIKTHRKLICRCSCGTVKEIFSSSLLSGKTKSCGCNPKPRPKSRLYKHVGKVYKRLTVIDVGEKIITKNSSYRNLICRCECGNISEVRSSSLLSGKTISCGCYNNKQRHRLRNDLTGQRFGKLVVIERVKNDKPYRRTLYKVKCDCGKFTNVTSSSLIKKNCQKSCGKCGLFRNGVMTSWIALDLNKLIPEAEHNHYTGVVFEGRNLNVDMALVEDKIAIEYDGERWHKNTQQRDRDKTMALIHADWKVLRIKSRRKIPEKQELLSLVNDLKTTEQDLIVLFMKEI